VLKKLLWYYAKMVLPLAASFIVVGVGIVISTAFSGALSTGVAVAGGIGGLMAWGVTNEKVKEAASRSLFGQHFPGYDDVRLPVYDLLSWPDSTDVPAGKVFALGVSRDHLFPISYIAASHAYKELTRKAGGSLLKREGPPKHASIPKADVIDVAVTRLDDEQIADNVEAAASDVTKRFDAAITRLFGGDTTVVPFTAFVTVLVRDEAESDGVAVWIFAFPTDVSDEVLEDLTNEYRGSEASGDERLADIVGGIIGDVNESAQDVAAEAFGLSGVEHFGDVLADVSNFVNLFTVRTGEVEGARGRLVAGLVADMIRAEVGMSPTA